VPLAERSQVERLGDLPIQSNQGFTVPLRELGVFQRVPEEDIIYRKDLRAVEYVVADVGGTLAAPVYGMMEIQDILDATDYKAPDGVVPQAYWTGPPPSDRTSSWEWAGEWTVTYETFRDMGGAFAVALVLIYILVVWEFGNFRIPLVIMAPIPLTLLGIIPAHFAMFHLGLGGEFTATSMIGWIALAGIIVRNSILLVDFSIHEVQKGVPVAEAVIRACKTRTRPILITALALVAGSSVIFTDPIFQGMAISLASGVLVSTVLTLIVIPLGCVAASKDLCEVAVATAPAGVNVPCSVEEREKAQKAATRPTPAANKPKIGGFAINLWGKLIGAIAMVFYLVRGIFLLLADLLKSLFKKKAAPAPKAPPSSPAGGTGAGGGGPAPTPPAAAVPVAGAPGAAAASAAPTQAGSVAAATPPPAATAAAPRPAPAKSEAPVGPKSAAGPAGRAAASSPSLGEADLTAEPAPPAEARATAVAAPDVATEPSAPSAVPTADRQSLAPVQPAKPAGRKTSAAKKTAGKKVAEKKAGAPKPALVRKKAPRRGIRLKVDGDQGMELD
jgi:hypothetical protein